MQLLAVLLLAALDIKFKASGYFYAGTDKPGVVGRRGQLALLALPDVEAKFEGYPGFKVMLINGTRAAVSFESQDGRLNIVREARDTDGRWRPSSTCRAVGAGTATSNWNCRRAATGPSSCRDS